MNRILAVRQKKTVLSMEDVENASADCKGFHESLLQAFDIVSYVKDYLHSHEKVDSRILLEIIDTMEDPHDQR